MNIRVLLSFALLCGLLAACGTDEEPVAAVEPEDRVSGTVTHNEAIALSASAWLEIKLEDVSRKDARARVVAQKRIRGLEKMPVAFELPYDPTDIDERMSYRISAQVYDKGKVLLVTDKNVPVLTRGAGRQVDLVLIGLRPPQLGPLGIPDKRKPKRPEQVSGGFEMKGWFRYQADAARFRDCQSNRSLPVAMEGAYIELENAYLNSGIEPGQEILVSFVGRRMERPAMEGNHNEINVIIDIFNALHPEETCSPMTQASLTGTYWKLVEVDGAEVVTPDGMKEAHLLLDPAGSRAHGNAGCNRFFGGFEAGETELAFSALGWTMMACPETMDTERAFLAALDATTTFRISGEVLELFDAEGGSVLARLEAVYR